jgi:hypothetical protein
VNEASAELAEPSKIARLGQRSLLRKSLARSDPDGCRRVPGAVIHVHRFFEPVRSGPSPSELGATCVHFSQDFLLRQVHQQHADLIVPAFG